MPTNEAKKKYDIQYAKEKLKRIPLDVKKEKYDEIKAAAYAVGEPVNGYIKKAIDERIERETLLSKTPAASNIKEPKPPKEPSDTVPKTDDPIHETLDQKLERLRREHSTQAPIGSNE